ncbi:MAG: histidinol dehydrogenase [Polyangiaceae bacterium]
MIPIVVEGTPEFDARLASLRSRGSDDLSAVMPAVREIIADVRRNGDEAVRRYVEVFERRAPTPPFVRDYGGAEALARIDADTRAALELAAERIAAYHERQLDSGYRYESEGVTLGLRVRPLRRVGVYAPGGKARYPSSVLMAAVPARVAGVKEIILASPAPDDTVRAAAHLAGVTGLLDAGGAQAVAALAYGTGTVPRVDKVVGPGNVYVACAKRLVFGDVDIDGIAGPSEVLVLADASADAELVASDLVSQAEHDEYAAPLICTTSQLLARQVVQRIEELLASLPRRTIAKASVDRRGVVLVVASRERMLEVADEVAAEHVAVHLERAEEAAEALHAAGAIFVGPSTPVAVGDYLAGPSHVLPTGGCVRFGSPLGVYDFVVRSSIIAYSPEALARHAPHVAVLARAEGLEGHARSVELRVGAREPPSSARSTPPRGFTGIPRPSTPAPPDTESGVSVSPRESDP